MASERGELHVFLRVSFVSIQQLFAATIDMPASRLD
jgi:hypothetical protein